MACDKELALSRRSHIAPLAIAILCRQNHLSIPHEWMANEKSNSTVNSSGRKFLGNYIGLDIISLLVKYYLQRAVGAY